MLIHPSLRCGQGGKVHGTSAGLVACPLFTPAPCLPQCPYSLPVASVSGNTAIHGHVVFVGYRSGGVFIREWRRTSGDGTRVSVQWFSIQ